MKQIHLIAAAALTLAVLVVSTYFQGVYTERWTDFNESPELAKMAERLAYVPLEFGEWEGEIIPDTPESADGYRKAKVKGHVDVAYRQTRTGKQVRVTLVCGHSRHVSRHTPDQCMVGAGFDPIDEPRTEQISTTGGDVAEYKTAQFMKRSVEGEVINQRMLWMWSNRGVWIGPTNNQLALSSAKDPLWYKLYVTTGVAGSKKTEDDQETLDFVKDFLPAINVALFPDRKESNKVETSNTES